MKAFIKTLPLLCLCFLCSCSSSVDFYKPIDIKEDGLIVVDSANTVYVFSVPPETMNFPLGALIEDKGDILKVFLVQAHDRSDTTKVDVRARLVKDDPRLLSKGFKQTSYYLVLPTGGRGFRFCNQGGCGDLNTVAQKM